MLVSSYLLNANWYVILMRCNSRTRSDREMSEFSQPQDQPARLGVCWFRVRASIPTPSPTADPGDVLVLVPSVSVMQSVCGFPAATNLRRCCQAFIFLINFNARKLLCCQAHVCIWVCASPFLLYFFFFLGQCVSCLVRWVRPGCLLLANNQIA